MSSNQPPGHATTDAETEHQRPRHPNETEHHPLTGDCCPLNPGEWWALFDPLRLSQQAASAEYGDPSRILPPRMPRGLGGRGRASLVLRDASVRFAASDRQRVVHNDPRWGITEYPDRRARYPRVALNALDAAGNIAVMRVNLITETAVPARPGAGAIPVSLTIRPSCGLPGDYTYRTNSSALLRMLNSKTDLPASVLRRFEVDVLSSTHARLLGVEMSERLLEDIGYFVD